MRVSVLTLLFAFSFATGSHITGDLSTAEYDTVVVIPDTHGDSEAAIRSLWLAHEKVNYAVGVSMEYDSFATVFYEYLDLKRVPAEPLAGRKTGVALVQLGDLIDRGPHSQDCIHVFQAVDPILGWNALNLYGNHELLAFTGYTGEMIHPEDARKYSSMANRASQFFHAAHPTFLGMARYASPIPLSAEVPQSENPNTLFVHAGVEIDWLEWFAHESRLPLEKMGSEMGRINQIVKDLMATKESATDAFSAVNSILWTRAYVELSDEDLCGSMIDSVLRSFDVARIVVGHNPQADMEIKTRCDGKIILADVMMSRWMTRRDVDEEEFEGGRPVAIIFTTDSATGKLVSLEVHHTELSSGVTTAGELPSDQSPVTAAGKSVRNMSPSTVANVPGEPIPQVIAEFLESRYSVVSKAILGDIRGFMHHFSGVGIPATLLSTLLGVPGMPTVVSSGPHPDGGFFLFTITKANQILSQWLNSGNHMRAPLRVKILNLVDAIHATGLCIGIGSPTDVGWYFGIDPRGRDAVLINWSGVHRCVGESDHVDEKKLVVSALVS